MSPLERFRYIRTLRMPTAQKCTLLILASHADRDGLCWPGWPLLAAETGLSRRSIAMCVAWLAECGLLIRRPRPGRSNTYALTLDVFRLASTTRAPTALPPVQQVHPEVAYKKVRKRALPHTTATATATATSDPRPICRSCKARLGDGESCIPCHKHRESLRGLHDVLPHG